MISFKKVSFAVCLSFVGVAISFGSAYSLFVKDASNASFTIAAKDVYYLNIYQGDALLSQNLLVDNPSNTKELMISNVSMSKGDKAKVVDNKGNFYGSVSSYTHNLTAAANTTNGYVSSTGDYIAAHDDTYDFYVKFTDDAHTSFSSVHANVDSTKVVYFYNNWGSTKTNFRCYYWSDSGNLISPSFDNACSMKTDDDCFFATVPSSTEKIIIRFHNTDKEDVDRKTVDIPLPSSGLGFQFDDWNEGTPTVKSWSK